MWFDLGMWGRSISTGLDTFSWKFRVSNHFKIQCAIVGLGFF